MLLEGPKKGYCSKCKRESFIDPDYGLVCCSLDDGSHHKVHMEPRGDVEVLRPSLQSRNYHLKKQREKCIDCEGPLSLDSAIWEIRYETTGGLPSRSNLVAFCPDCSLRTMTQRLRQRGRNRKSRNSMSVTPKKESAVC